MRLFVYRIFLIFIFTSISFSALSQDFSNRGTDFWVVYSGHIDALTSRMALYITSNVNTSGTVSVNGKSTDFSVTANQVTVVQLSNTSPLSNADAYLTSTNISQLEVIGINKGIHIKSQNPVVVYSHILNSARSGSTLVLPTKVLGREYVVATYKSTGNIVPLTGAGAEQQKNTEFEIIATEDGTNVEITPTNSDYNNRHLANVTFDTILNKGDVYQYQSFEDLTGTKIKSVATSTLSCKKIAVYAGSTWTAMGCSGAGSGDNLYQQLFPTSSWGKHYYTSPAINRKYDLFRILVQDPTSLVYVNGVALNPSTLINNSFYEISTSGDNSYRDIYSDKPISVLQYFITMGCDGSNAGDPEMIALNPIEQTLNDITVMSARRNLTPPNTNITSHFLNIIFKSNAFSSLKIDGAAPTAIPKVMGTTGYSYIQEDVTSSTETSPSHRIVCDSGFICIAYGFGNVESYGYNAGANVKDLNQQLTVENKYATVQLPITCKGTLFTPSITLPYIPLSLKWIIPKYDTIIDNSPAADSSYISVTGKLIYKFTLKAKLKYDSVGTYNIELIVNNPTADGCSGEQQLNFDLLVTSAPKVDNKIITSNCISDTITLKDNTLLSAEDRSLSNYIWNVDNGVQGNSKSFKFLPNKAGKFVISYFVINDVGCISDTIVKEILIDSLPKVNFETSAFKCQKQEITFTDASLARGSSVLKKLAWDFGDYSVVDTLDISKKSVVHSFDSLRNYTVSLAVITENGCIAKQSQIIKNNPIPQVGFILPEVCLLDPFAQFKDTTKIADLSNNFKYKWNFGDASNTSTTNTDTTQNPKHKYINTGDYTVSLEVTSKAGCIASTAVQFTVNGTFPNAIFKVVNDTALCSNKEVEIINKSTVDIGSIGKIIIFWDYDRNLTDTTVDQNPSFDKSYKHLYKNFIFPGKMNFNIKIMAYSGGICADDTATSITIVPPPTSLAISSNKDYACMYDTLSFRAAIEGGLSPFSYEWKTDNTAAIFNNNILKGMNAGNVKISVIAKDIKQCTYDYNNLKLLEVKSVPTAILKAKDTIICNEDPVTLKGEGNYLFTWFTNGMPAYTSRVDSFSTTINGFYKLKVNDGQCNSLFSDSIFIRKLIIPKYTLSYNPTICINTPLALNTNAEDARNIYFKWDFGDTKTFDKAKAISHSYAATGSYMVKLAITNDYCPKYEQFLQGDSVKVVLPISPSTFTLFVLADIDTVLSPLRKDPGYTQFAWNPSTYLDNPSIEHPLFRSNKSINYTLTRTEVLTACKVEDIYKMDVSDLVVVSIPKAFTPNNDNLNDILKIEYGAGLKTFHFLKIFNRWGNIVFQTTNLNQGWDGNYNGIPQEMDAYTYFMSYITYKDEPVSKTGSFILLR
ncbi:MAG: PKD domain-containing protein [Chitinophagia bacterium]|nr:PKD domain-containing protein [Chitinophagia bacterium]